MLQKEEKTKMTLEGKKKFTTTISAMVVGFVGLLVTNGIIGDQVAATATQVAAVALPLGCAFIYDLIQGSHDKRKLEVRKVEVEVEQRFLMEKEKAPATPAADNPEVVAAPPSLPRIDFKAFHRAVEQQAETIKSTQIEDPPDARARLAAFRMVGGRREWSTDDFRDVETYTNLFVGAAEEAFAEASTFPYNDSGRYLIGGEFADKLGACPTSRLETLALRNGFYDELRELWDAYEKLRNVNAYRQKDPAGTYWTSRIGFDHSLFYIMNVVYDLKPA